MLEAQGKERLFKSPEMKVGITRTQLAWAFIAYMRAIKVLPLFYAWLLFVPNMNGNEFPAGAAIVLPFHLVGKSVFVEAVVDGKTGYYLFVIGSPLLIL